MKIYNNVVMTKIDKLGKTTKHKNILLLTIILENVNVKFGDKNKYSFKTFPVKDFNWNFDRNKKECKIWKKETKNDFKR